VPPQFREPDPSMGTYTLRTLGPQPICSSYRSGSLRPTGNDPRNCAGALPRGISPTCAFVRRAVEFQIFTIKAATDRDVGANTRCCANSRTIVPVVAAFGTVLGRTADNTDEGPRGLLSITRHLQFSLPYAVLFTGAAHADLRSRLLTRSRAFRSLH